MLEQSRLPEEDPAKRVYALSPKEFHDKFKEMIRLEGMISHDVYDGDFELTEEEKFRKNYWEKREWVKDIKDSGKIEQLEKEILEIECSGLDIDDFNDYLSLRRELEEAIRTIDFDFMVSLYATIIKEKNIAKSMSYMLGGHWDSILSR